jgi:hypothetical protein
MQDAAAAPELQVASFITGEADRGVTTAAVEDGVQSGVASVAKHCGQFPLALVTSSMAAFLMIILLR